MEEAGGPDEPASGVARLLAGQVVEGCLGDLERDARSWRANQYVMRTIHCAVTLLGDAAIAARFERLVPDDPQQRDYILRAPGAIDALYPPYDESRVQALVYHFGQSAPHVACCLGKNYRQALALARSERARAEVALAQLALGDFAAAEQFVEEHVRPAFRSHGVRLVLAVELFRHGRHGEARRVLAALPELHSWDLWHRAQLALGLLGREMWAGYPFPQH